jgi:hypothetical protein
VAATAHTREDISGIASAAVLVGTASHAPKDAPRSPDQLSCSNTAMSGSFRPSERLP